jgi:hypothetical protein
MVSPGPLRCRQWHDGFPAVDESHDRWFMKDVLVESCEEERAIAANRSAKSESELMLLAGGLYIEACTPRVEAAVSQIVEAGSMKLVRSGLRHNVDYRAARPACFRRACVRRHTNSLMTSLEN